MTGHVAIVTDSTASLSAKLAAGLDIAVVGLQLHVGDNVDDEGRVEQADVIRAMQSLVPVSTSPPPAEAFFWAYQDAAMRGAEAVVSVHLSTGLSATCESAQEAAAQVGIPVHVVDSRSASMGLGYPVIAAAQAAATGAPVREVLEVLEHRLETVTELLYVDTLEYLRRGGRIGAASAFLGTALKIKPLLTVKEGRIVPLDRARGTDRALARLIKTAVKTAGNRLVDVAVEHFGASKQAEALANRLRAAIPQSRQFLLAQTSAIIGAHVGPGALGVTISPC